MLLLRVVILLTTMLEGLKRWRAERARDEREEAQWQSD
jgi:hypothetical protein